MSRTRGIVILVVGASLLACTGATEAGTSGTSGGSSGAGATSGGTTGQSWPSVTTLVHTGQKFQGIFSCEGLNASDPAFEPLALAVDAKGNVYEADSSLEVISPSGAASPWVPYANDGNVVRDVTISPDGSVFISMAGNGGVLGPYAQIFRVNGSQDLTWVAGAPNDRTCIPNGEPDAGFSFATAFAIAADVDDDVFVADATFDSSNKCDWVVKVSSDGNSTPFAGDGSYQSAPYQNPGGMVVDGEGNLYVSDTSANRILKIDPTGATTVLAGGGSGFSDGTGGPNGTAGFSSPGGLAFDLSGNLLVADRGNNAVRVVAMDGTTTTLAGNGQAGDVSGTLGRQGTTEFSGPMAVAVDSTGAVYVADFGNCAIKIIRP